MNFYTFFCINIQAPELCQITQKIQGFGKNLWQNCLLTFGRKNAIIKGYRKLGPAALKRVAAGPTKTKASAEAEALAERRYKI